MYGWCDRKTPEVVSQCETSCDGMYTTLIHDTDGSVSLDRLTTYRRLVQA